MIFPLEQAGFRNGLGEKRILPVCAMMKWLLPDRIEINEEEVVRASDVLEDEL